MLVRSESIACIAMGVGVINTLLIRYERVNDYECRMFSFLLFTQVLTEGHAFSLVHHGGRMWRILWTEVCL